MDEDARYETKAALPFVLPFVAVYALLFIYPTAQMVLSSFTSASLTLPGDWVGFANYTKLFGDKQFWMAAYNTLYFVVLTVIPTTILGLAIAMMVGRMRGRWQSLVLALFFLPYVLPASVVASIWYVLLDSNTGLLAAPINLLMGRSISVLRLNGWFLPTVAVITVWWTLGFTVLLFLAGLRNIPPDLYEVATIDRVGRVPQFRFITWPLIWPVTALVLTIQLILQLKVFDQVYLLTTSGRTPVVLVEYIYIVAFQQNASGYGATVALALFLLVIVVSVLQYQVLRAHGAR